MQLITKHTIQRVAIGFIDNTDFYGNRDNTESNMKNILTYYSEYYKVIGGKILVSKLTYFYLR